MNVLIVDDHPVVRKGLRTLLEEDFERPSIGEAESSGRALELIRGGTWDIVILDITLPPRNGLDVLREIKAERPKLPVLVLSMHPEDQYAVRAFRAGAAGYMTKETAPKELADAIRTILARGRYVGPSLAGLLAEVLSPEVERQPHENLSDREFQVLCLIAVGRSTAEIAAGLCLSPKTVATFRARILEKMGMKNTAELIRYAIHRGLVD
jgi:two-component system invasion response regulator UvrY